MCTASIFCIALVLYYSSKKFSVYTVGGVPSHRFQLVLTSTTLRTSYVKSRDTFGYTLFYCADSLAVDVGCGPEGAHSVVKMALFRITATRISDAHQVNSQHDSIITSNLVGYILTKTLYLCIGSTTK
jgi:hypothetical protein